MKKYIAELFGTFVLTLVVLLSLSGVFAVSTAVLAVLTVMLFVYAFWDISGGHINPAVTIGVWSIKKIDTRSALGYMVFQVLGGLIALLLFSYLGFSVVPMISGNNLMLYFAEFFGMAVYGFFIAAVVFEKTPKNFHGLLIAGALLIGISLASLLGSSGLINPAVALGLRSFDLAYLISPLLGSIVGMQFFRYFLD